MHMLRLKVYLRSARFSQPDSMKDDAAILRRELCADFR